MRETLLPTIISAFLFSACAVEPVQTVPFANVEEARFLSVGEPKNLIFRDQTRWKAFWDRYMFATDSAGNRIPPPSIAFEKEMVLALFWGLGYGGCTNEANAISTIEIIDGKVVVNVGEVQFLGLCRAVQHPQQVITLGRVDLPVVLKGKVPGLKKTL